MKIALESTTKIVSINGVPARVWEGVTDSGVRVHAFITRIAVAVQDDATQFEAELTECRTPSPEIEGIPARLIL